METHIEKPLEIKKMIMIIFVNYLLYTGFINRNLPGFLVKEFKIF